MKILQFFHIYVCKLCSCKSKKFWLNLQCNSCNFLYLYIEKNSAKIFGKKNFNS